MVLLYEIEIPSLVPLNFNENQTHLRTYFEGSKDKE